MRAYPTQIAMIATGLMAKLVHVETSLPGFVFTEAALLRVHRPKTITGTVTPATKATQKRTSSKREGNRGGTCGLA